MDLSLLDSWQGRLGAALVLLVLVFAWAKQRRRTTATGGSSPRAARALDAVDTVIGWPPEATRVMTMRHRRAFDLLRRAVPECMVLAQVPLARFLRVPTRMSYAEWLRRVGHVCVDLVICDPASNVIGVIEIRDTDKADNERTTKRRTRVEKVLRASGIPLHVWNDAWLPDPLAVRRLLIASEAPEASRAAPDVDTEPQQLDPPRTSWFDEINATRPAGLDELPVPQGRTGAGQGSTMRESAVPSR